MKILTLFLFLSLFIVSTPFAFAQAKSPNSYKLNILVSGEKKPKELGAKIIFERDFI